MRSDIYLYAIDAVNGSVRRRFKNADGSPAVSESIVYVGSYDNNLYAIDAVTREWRNGGSKREIGWKHHLRGE